MTNTNEFTYPEKIRLSPEQVKEISKKIQQRFLGKTAEEPQPETMPVITNFRFCLNCQQKEAVGETQFCSANCMRIRQTVERQQVEAEKEEMIRKILAFVAIAVLIFICGFVLYFKLFTANFVD